MIHSWCVQVVAWMVPPQKLKYHCIPRTVHRSQHLKKKKNQSNLLKFLFQQTWIFGKEVIPLSDFNSIVMEIPRGVYHGTFQERFYITNLLDIGFYRETSPGSVISDTWQGQTLSLQESMIIKKVFLRVWKNNNLDHRLAHRDDCMAPPCTDILNQAYIYTYAQLFCGWLEASSATAWCMVGLTQG